MNEEKIEYKENTLLKASFGSKLIFGWIKPLLKLGRKKRLGFPDLYSPTPEDESSMLTDDLEKEWARELKKKPNPSLTRVLFRWYRTKILLNSIFVIIQEIIKIFQPLLISIILQFFNDKMELGTAIGIAVAISACAMIGGIMHHPYYFNAGRYGMRLRLACSGLIYRKALRLSTKNLDSKSSGDVINLLSTDVSRIEFGILYIPYLFVGPIQAAIVIVIIVLEVGWTFLAGFIIILASYPVKALISRAYNKFRTKNCKASDERVSVLTEILNSIKIIKMYCWEIPFSKNVTDLRNKELKFQAILNLLQSFTASIDTIMATMVTLLNITFFIAFTERRPLLPTYTVFAIGFYMRLCNTIGFNFTRSIIYFSNLRVSTKRVQKFLLIKELPSLQESSKGGDTEKTPLYKPNISGDGDKTQSVIEIKNLNFSWTDDDTGFSLNNININIKHGEFVAIVGPVGAGKTSMLMAILKELENYTGSVTVNAKIYYITQQPWVFTASIRQNITFGSPFDREKFDKIVQVCSLKKDLELLPLGENTLVGEKGINLSGGQRARICLARALYSDSDVYLFDDTLSAVDGTVAKNIIRNCINGYLKNKTRVLITHQVHHLETADNIIVLRDGTIQAQGTYRELLDTHLASLSTMNADESYQIEELEAQEEVPDENIEKEAKAVTDEFKAREEMMKKDREEGMEEGAVGIRSYISYFTAGAGIIGILFALILFLAAQGMAIAADYWLSVWATNEELYVGCIRQGIKCDQVAGENNSTLISYLKGDYRRNSFTIYLIFCFIALFLVLVRSSFFYLLCVLNSKKVYEKMFASVRDTCIRFFELNPIGRILNRFSKDTNNMDEMLTLFLYEFLQVLMIILGALVVPIIVNPYMLIPLVPLGIVFYVIQKYFITTGRQLKRMDNAGRSPIFIHANNTLEGITTVRVANKQNILIREFHDHCDYHTRAYFSFIGCHRWFGLRLDLLCSIYTIVTLFACLFLKGSLNLQPGQVGLLMVYLFQLFDLFQWCVILTVYVENLMTSIERIVEYTNIPAEPLHTGIRKPPSDEWPHKGEIEFKNVSLSYDKNLPNVLKDINLRIKPAEKVGIVGRTGAGKSSFFQTIFRMYEPIGDIIVDGVPIKELTLVDLRNKLTIIPQEPILFSGSVRFNLDPYGKYTDTQIWNSLESVNLKSLIKGIPDGLGSSINSGGTNLSVGEKQLICLARAILKKTRILIIDEATANVDYKTDQIIQKTIREQFKECTVLTIAHRLATVVDSDRILCLSEGEVKNFDSPRELLNDTNSILFDLTKKLSANEKKYIFDIAFGRISLVDNYSFSDIKAELKKKQLPNTVEHQPYSNRPKTNYAYYDDEFDDLYNNILDVRF